MNKGIRDLSERTETLDRMELAEALVMRDQLVWMVRLGQPDSVEISASRETKERKAPLERREMWAGREHEA